MKRARWTKSRWIKAFGAGTASLALLAACANAESSLADELNDRGDLGYIAGDGRFTEVSLADRGETISFEGIDEYGETIASSEFLGEVTVVNFWYAGCPPCRAEAPSLAALDNEFSDNGVNFVGANVYDQPPQVFAFNETYGISYPSVMDVETAGMRLAFAGQMAPNAIPSTFVLDSEGRVAWRYLGQVDEGNLRDMIQETVDESQGDTPDGDGAPTEAPAPESPSPASTAPTTDGLGAS